MQLKPLCGGSVPHGLFLKRHLMLAGCSKVFMITTEGALVYAKKGAVFVGRWFGHGQDRRRKFKFATKGAKTTKNCLFCGF